MYNIFIPQSDMNKRVSPAGVYSKAAAESQRPCYGHCLARAAEDGRRWVRVRECGFLCAPYLCPECLWTQQPAFQFTDNAICDDCSFQHDDPRTSGVRDCSHAEHVSAVEEYSPGAADLQRPCFGACLGQCPDCGPNAMVRVSECDLKCVPFMCPEGRVTQAPAWFFHCHNGVCVLCAVAICNGSDHGRCCDLSPDEEEEDNHTT